jgi:PAS domain S-box-containing protein
MSDTTSILLIVISLVLQALAAIMALWLAWARRDRLAWRLIAVGLTLMLARQCVTLIGALFPSLSDPMRGSLVEGIVLVTSVLMLGGVTVAVVMFQRMAETENYNLRQREQLAAVASENARLYRTVRASEERYRTLVENIPIGVYRTTPGPQGQFLLANSTFLKMFGFDSEKELEQVAVADLYADPADRQAFSEMLLERGSVQGVELKLKNKEGTLWGLVTARVSHEGSSGEVSYFDCSIQDITERKQIEAELERRLSETLLLNRVMAAASSALEPDAVLRIMCEELAHAFNLPQAAFALLDADRAHLTVVAEYRAEGRPSALGVVIPITDNEATQYVLERRAPLAIHDAQTDPRQAVIHDLEKQRGVVSLLIVPVTTRDQVLGTLGLDSVEPREFSAAEIELARNVASAASQVLEKAQLYEAAQQELTERKRAERELQRSNRDLSVLNAITAAVSRSLDMTEVLNDTLDKTLEVMQLNGEARGGIFLVNERVGELHLAAVRGLPAEFIERETTVSLDKCLCGWVAETGEVVNATLGNTWLDPRGWVEPHGHLLVPLRSKGKVLGVMFLYLPAGHQADEADMRLLTAIGSQIGVGIENARLYENMEAQARDLELLYEVGQKFSSSLDPEEVLSRVAGRCAQVFEADTCLVHLIGDGASSAPDKLASMGQRLILHASFYRSPPERAAVEQHLLANPVRVGEGIIGQAAATGEAVLSTWVDLTQLNQPESVDYWQSHHWLLTPLRAQDRVTGVLTLIARRRFNAHDLTVAQEIANQAAAALANARLYREVNRRLEQVSLIQSMALAGAIGKPFDEIVAEATERLRQLWDSHNLGFLFPDETGALKVHPSYFGAPPDVKLNARFLPGQGITGAVFQSGQPIIVPDVRQDPRFIEGPPESRSEMAAPLLVGDRVIGVINVESPRLDAFQDDDLRLLSALAGQLAIILDNVEAHRDLADRAQQLQDAYNELAEAEKLKDQLIQNISHELRTPLTFLKGYSELMLEEAFGEIPPSFHDPLRIVRQKTDTVVRLIERIISLQAMSPQALDLEPLNLADLVDEAVDRWKPQMQRMGIRTRLDVLPDLPPVVGDRKRLAEALDNLLCNVVKFSPRGGQATIRLRAQHELVHAEIADTGIGIPPDKLSKVFNRFYQVDGTSRRRFGGAGVGLALVRKIIEAHGGRVWAESPGLGQGSTFHLMLPISPVV